MAIRWGILGAGKISEDFVKAINRLPETDHKVVAIAARSLQRARECAQKLNIPKAYGSYEELAKDPENDVVYIGTIHPYHAEQSKMLLTAGKPVLCEKPICMNARETSEVLSLAKDKNLFVMEAFRSRFFPVYDRLREELQKGTIGDPRVVNVQFGKNLQHQERMSRPELGGGALYILGGYCIQLADLVFADKPEKITAAGTLLPSGVDDTSTITLQYSGGRMAVLTTSASCVLDQRATIHGTKGIIEIPEKMWIPTDIIINGNTFTYPLPEPLHQANYERTQTLAFLAEHVRACLLSGLLESPLMTHESTLTLAEIMDQARDQLRVN